MSRLAVGDHPVMSVSDLEGRRPGRSYSIETLQQIRQEVGPAWELYFYPGAGCHPGNCHLEGL